MTAKAALNHKQDYWFYFITILGVALFVPLFIYRQIVVLDFWWWMSINLFLLIFLSLLTSKKQFIYLKKDISSRDTFKIFYGIASAVVLYILFYFGNILIRQMFDFAGGDIQQVYGFKGDADALRIGLLMLFIIGPGEELFWRGYIQGILSEKLGKMKGYLLATALYTLVHVATGNLVLILAALVCGLFWGWLFLKYKSVLMNSISHTVWDITVFILLPFSV